MLRLWSKITLLKKAWLLFALGSIMVSAGCSKSDQPALGPASDSQALTYGEPFQLTEANVDMARMLTQASYGVSQAGMVDIGQYATIEAWIDAQMALPATAQLPDVKNLGHSSFRPARHYVWWDTALNADDQLRQRVAFALSEIFVVSDIDYTLGNSQHGIVNYYDMLAANAFGGFRDLLEQITLHPVMGIYLSMVRNEKADAQRNIRPDENFAREIMQLFTIGLYKLDEGGEPVPLDNPEPAYTQADVEEYARVFTGWNFADSPEWQSIDLTPYDKISALVPQEQFHDSGSKQLLGGVVAPAGLTAREDLDVALDSLFAHQNVGPFISKALIQRLVSSNPTRDYVERVAAVFSDDGKGVRGNLGAVVKAILLDDEARQVSRNSSGKLKEPLLRATHMMRALNAVPGASSDGKFHMYSKTADQVDDIFGQSVLSSPSVFNFFSPSYLASVSTGGGQNASDQAKLLYAPELQILNESLVSAANNDLHSVVYGGHNRIKGRSRAAMINIDEPMAVLRKGRDVYLNHMNVLLMSGMMSGDMQKLLAGYLTETVNAGPNAKSSEIDQKLGSMDDKQLETMVLDTVFMMLASPEFMVQR